MRSKPNWWDRAYGALAVSNVCYGLWIFLCTPPMKAWQPIPWYGLLFLAGVLLMASLYFFAVAQGWEEELLDDLS